MYKVLIADDETFVRTLLEKNLQSSGLPIQVIASAEDGKEALEKAIEFSPDIIVTDISMPFMNGLDFIRSLQEREIKTKNIIISGYDEFDYARTAISLGVTDYLLKPFLPRELISIFEKMIRELDSQKTLKQNLQMLRNQADKYRILNRDHTIKAILEGHIPSSEEKAQLGFTQAPSSNYLTCILSVNGTIWNFHIQDQVEEFLKLVKSGYFSEALCFYGIGIETNKLAVCFNSGPINEKKFLEEIIAGIEKLSHSMLQYYDIVLYCSVGRVYHQLLLLEDSYQEALSVWNESLDPTKRIMIYGEKRQESILASTGNSNQIRNLKSCIRGAVSTGSFAKAQGLLQQLMQLYALDSRKGSEYVFISIGELLYGIAEDLEKMGLVKNDRKELQKLNQKKNLISLLEVQEMVEGYLRNCCSSVAENLSVNRSETAIRLVQDYIEEQLSDHTITIESAADMVYFSVSYLRQIFKEVTGESFNEYLIRKRMEKAGELLQNTSMKIQDISESCGYENQRYFASSFKKFFGCTPTEFKNIILKDHLY